MIRILVLFLSLFSALAMAAPQPVTVSVSTAKKNEIFDAMSYPAQVASRVNASISSDIDGVVTEIRRSIGQRVRRGQVLLVIKHIDPVFQYAPLKVRAPVDGVVSQIKVSVGSRVAKAEQVASVTDPNKVQLTIEVTANELKKVSRGFKGLFQAADIEKPIPVIVKGISPYVDPATGTATCELTVVGKPKNLNILPGMVGRVHFSLNKRKGFLIPERALVHRGDQTFVRIVKDDVVDLVPIKVGKKEKGFAEILTGLHEGDTFVARSSGFVTKGDKVQVHKEKQEGKAGG